MKRTLAIIAVCFFALATRPVLAQSGCDDSPENPTLILAGLAAGAFAISNLRQRSRR